MSSLVVQTSFLGDVILTTPLIAELARRGPVDVVTTPESAAVLANNPGIRNVVVYDKRGADRGVSGFRRTVNRIRAAGLDALPRSPEIPEAGSMFEAAYMAQGSIRSAALVRAAGISNRIGFHTSSGRAFYTSRVAYRADRHHAERLWWLSMSECADEPQSWQIRPRLYPSAVDIESADGLLRTFSSATPRPFVALAPGSAWGTKRWPYFQDLAVLLAETHDIVVLGGSEDAALGETIIAGLPKGTGINAAGRTGLLASAELIRRAAALVTNDSAPQHIASAMGTPTVTLFGPTVPEFGFGPLGPASSTAGHEGLACRPCDSHGPHRCPLGHWRCMRELSSGSVFALLVQTLSQANER